MAANAIICAVNRFDEGTYTEGPDETLRLDFVNDVYGIDTSNSTALPVSNLKDRQLSKVWRTLNADPNWTWFTCDFGVVRQIDVFALLSTNLTSSGKIRIRLASDPYFYSVVYDSGLQQAWPILPSFGVKPWGVWTWGESIGSIESPPDLKPNCVFVLPSSYSARYMRVDISDSLNPSGYIQAGRCYAGPKFQPTKNISYGWEIGYLDDSTFSKSLGGQTYANILPRYREVKLTFEYLTQEEVYLNLFEFIDRRKGSSGDVLFIPQPDRTDLFLFEVIYGRMSQLGSISQPYYSVVTKSYTIEELI